MYRDRSLYFSVLPNDINNIINLNILLNYDYNHFINYCNNNCSDNIWRQKGIMDFIDFDATLGISYKAKYLRKAARAEFNILRTMTNSKSAEKELTQLRESDYRHQAKLLDYNGRYDNFRSYNYILSAKLIQKLNGDNPRQIFASFVPKDLNQNWFVVIRSNENILFFIVKTYENFNVYNIQQYGQFIHHLRQHSVGLNTNNLSANDILRIYDFTTTSL